MSDYNKYHESLVIDCCKKLPKPKAGSKDCCPGMHLPSQDNENEILVRRLTKEVKDLMKSTEARLLCQNKKIDETMVYIKNNLSNAIRNLLVSMEESGELDQLIRDIVIESAEVLENQIKTLEDRTASLERDNGVNQQAIGVNTVAIRGLQKTVDNLQIKQNKMVVFGDSWSDPEVQDAIWSATLASELHLENVNYAINGAGFVAPADNLISTQIANFISSDIDKNTVKYIIVVGGINDYINHVNVSTLYETIKTNLDQLQAVCPNSKIVYISNCQYPYTKDQMNYWNTVHNAVLKYNSLNLTNKIGLPLFNASLFHLTQVGQIWLAKNINALLTGGELLTYLDQRTFEDDVMKVEYVNIPQTNNSTLISIVVYLKQGCTNHTINIGDVNLSYGGETGLFGTKGTSFNTAVCDTTANTITFAFENLAYSDAYYYLNQVVFTPGT